MCEFYDRRIQWLYGKLRETEMYLYFAQAGKKPKNDVFGLSVTMIKSEIERLKKAKQSVCSHEWTHDLIDIDPDRSMAIVYCALCEYV